MARPYINFYLNNYYSRQLAAVYIVNPVDKTTTGNKWN